MEITPEKLKAYLSESDKVMKALSAYRAECVTKACTSDEEFDQKELFKKHFSKWIEEDDYSFRLILDSIERFANAGSEICIELEINSMGYEIVTFPSNKTHE